MIIIYIQLALMSVTMLFVLAAATLGKDAGNGLLPRPVLENT